MFCNHLTAALAASLTLAPLAAYSESHINTTCFASLIPDMLLGDYVVETSPLKMNIGGTVMYQESWETGTARLYHDELLNYTLGDLGAPVPDFKLFESDELQPEWYWDADPRLTPRSRSITSISSDDLEILVGCKLDELPRLTGQFTTLAQDGTPLEHTMRLILLDDDWLFGSWSWVANAPQGRVEAFRSISLVRQN